jgi:hypothetical protein
MKRKTMIVVIAMIILSLQYHDYHVSASTTRYNLQMGEAFTNDVNFLMYNITAVAQNNTLGLGPAYLLNGLADNGYWYQVGIAYNWFPNLSAGRGFSLIYTVFAPNGSIVYPLNSNAAGLQRFNGVVNNGDLIQLTLAIGKFERIYMSAYDYNTGATSFTSYLSYNATRFVGSVSSPINSHGYFTGIMTEQYFPDSNISNPILVSFTSKYEINSSYMFIDLTDRYSNSVILYKGRFVQLNPYQPQELDLNNLTEFATSFGLFTGNSSGKSFTLPVLNLTSSSSALNPVVLFENSIILGCSQVTTAITSSVSSGKIIYGFSVIEDTDVGSKVQFCFSLPNSLLSSTASVVWLVNDTAVFVQNFRSSIYNYTFIPESEGIYLVSVQVFDQQKTLIWYTMPVHLKVNAEPEIESLSFSDAASLVEVNVIGGTPPFTYTWYIDNKNFSVTQQPFLTLPEGMRPHYIHVTVRDSAGNFASSGYYFSQYLSSSILELMLLLVSIFFVSSFFAVFCEIGKRRILTKLRE